MFDKNDNLLFLCCQVLYMSVFRHICVITIKNTLILADASFFIKFFIYSIGIKTKICQQQSNKKTLFLYLIYSNTFLCVVVNNYKKNYEKL